MIEVRIDRSWMEEHQHNVMHSILMMGALRAAGMPVVGKIIFHGPERGTINMHFEDDIDGGIFVVRWFDTDETGAALQLPISERGHGKGYTWRRYGAKPVNPEDEEL